MRCPYCGNDDTQVKDSRPTEDSGAIRRRRVCNGCGGRFTTFERVQLRELMIVKRSGKSTAEGIRFGRMEMSYFLGIAYLEGATVSQDSMLAVRWLQRAANLGSRNAAARLGAATAR